MKDTAAELLPGQRAEEPFDQVQPRRAGPREVQKDPLPPLDPVHDLGVLVGLRSCPG